MEPSSEATSQPTPGRPLFERGLVAIISAPRPVSEEVRASHAAVRAAREEMMMKQRRDTLRLRAFTATALVTFVAGALALEHFRKGHQAIAGTLGPDTRAQVQTPLPALPLSAAVATVLAAPVGTESAAETESPPTTSATDLLAACKEAVGRRRLRTAAVACPAAFAAQPPDASLAMRIAKVQHARGQYVEAGVWARQAIALEVADPDAFIILAHGEKRTGNPAAAGRAYQRYLALAPRGWHAAEAREAVRVTRAEAKPAAKVAAQ